MDCVLQTANYLPPSLSAPIQLHTTTHTLTPNGNGASQLLRSTTPVKMDVSVSAKSFPAPSFRRRSNFAAPVPVSVRPVLNPEERVGGYYLCHFPRNSRLSVTAVQRIQGVSEELNAMAAQNLDHASARRKLRSAFADLQLQLDHCLFKMAPTNVTTNECYERNSRGLRIFCKSWKPEQVATVKGAVFFCHGYGDTCTFFFEGIARFIAASGYCVYAIDHPGFGLSDGLHGYVHSFDELADNVIEQYSKIKARPELRGLPCYLLGQSMGGAVALKVHLKDPREWDGMVLVAPMCRISEDMIPPAAIFKVLSVLSNVLPTAKLVPQKDLAELAIRDPKKRELAVYNVICYNNRTRLRTAMELLKAASNIEKQADKVSSPLLILHGAADKVTDPSVSKFLHEKASSTDKTLKLYENGYHCILEGEPDERIFTVLGDITDWLDARSSKKHSLSLSSAV